MVYKAYGCIVVDTEQKNVKALHIPVILDLVQDRVRSRVYSVLLTLLVIVYGAFWALGPALRDPSSNIYYSSVSEIKIVLPAAYTVSWGGILSPPLLVTLYTPDGSLVVNETVTLIAVPVHLEDSNELALLPFNAALGGIVSRQTDLAGSVQFTNITFSGNSKVQYHLYCIASSKQSNPVLVTVTTQVASVSFVSTPYTTITPSIGQPILYPFFIQVLDSAGNPLPNKEVIATINPYVDVNTIIPAYGILDNYIQVTNGSGIAVFNSITVVAATQPRFNFKFYCEGISFTPSVTELSIECQSTVGRLDLNIDKNGNIITVYDTSGNPVSNKTVIALVTTEGGYKAYPPVLTVHKNFYYMVLQSDNNGRVFFYNTECDSAGFYGTYGITYFCDGIASEEWIFKLNNVVFMNLISPDTITLNEDDPANFKTPVIIIVQLEDNDPQKKASDVALSISALSEWNTEIIFGYALTDENGFAIFALTSLPFAYTNQLIVRSNIYSVIININYTTSFTKALPSIFATNNINGEVYSVETEGEQPDVLVYNGTQNNCGRFNVSATWIEPSDFTYYFPFVLGRRQGYTMLGSGTTNEHGDVNFTTPFGFSSGVSGSVAFGFRCANCDPVSVSNVYIVTVYNPILSIQLNAPTRSLSTLFRLTPSVQPHFVVTLALGTISSGYLETLYPTIAVLQGETFATYSPKLQMLSLFVGDGQQTTMDDTRFAENWFGYISPFPCSLSAPSIGTCSFGSMTVKGLPGKYTLAVVVAGVISNSFTIEIGNEVTNIVPIVTSITQFNVTLDEQFPITAAVQILGDQGAPLQGYYATIMPCAQSNLQIVNEEPNCETCFLSSSSDENGMAEFSNLKIFAGTSGVYSLCFQLNEIGPIMWNVTINYTNAIVFASIESFNGLVVPNTQYLATFVISSQFIAQEFIAPVSFLQLEGPGNLSLEYYPRHCVISTGLTKCQITYVVSGESGYYALAVYVAGYELNAHVTLLLNTIPISLLVYSSENTIIPSLRFNAVLYEPTTLLVKVQLQGGASLLDANLTLTLVSSPFESLPGAFVTASSRNSPEYIYLSIIFTQGASGDFDFLLTSPPLTTLLTIQLTNPIAEIVITNAELFEDIDVEYGSDIPYGGLNVTVYAQPGFSCNYKAVEGFLRGYKEQFAVFAYSQVYSIVPNNSICQAIVQVYVNVDVPGIYELQLEIDGVVSNTVRLNVINLEYPNYEHLSIHNTQEKVLLGVLLLIPLFIGNSARHPSWQIIISLPALAVIGYVANSYLGVSINTYDMGGNYYLLLLALCAIVLGTLLVFVITVIRLIYSAVKKRPTTLFASKLQACQVYIRQSLLAYGMKRYHTSIHISNCDENEQTKQRMTPRKIVAWIVARMKRLKQPRQQNAFYYPQRLLIGCAASLTCSFVVSLSCNLLTEYILRKLKLWHTVIGALINAAQRLQDFTSEDGAFLTDKIIEMSSILNMTPQQIQEIVETVYGDSTDLLRYGTKAAILIYNASNIIYIASMTALAVTAAIHLVCWYFVFKTYRQRVFMLRKGKLEDIIVSKKHYSIDKAANYVSLQVLHSSIAFFVLWFVFTSVVSVLQLPDFWQWIYSYYPVLLTFLVGFPFVSKTIARFVVSRWILKEGVILHLRLWLIFDFMWIFVNMLSAFVLSVVRFVVSFFSNIVYTMRMDHPLLREEIEYYDYGFNSYMGMLLMDHENNNPIFLQFCELLIADFKSSRSSRKSKFLEYAKEKFNHSLCNCFSVAEEEENMYAPLLSYKAKARAQTRWWLLVTLHNNPKLRLLRKHALKNAANAN